MITSALYSGTYEQVGADAFRLKVQLTDDVAGISTQWFTASGATGAEVRDDISRQIDALNSRRAVKAVIDGLAANTNIPVTYTPPAAPALTAAQVWVEKARRLARLRAMGTLANGTLATAITNLQSDVQNTYQAGFIDGV